MVKPNPVPVAVEPCRRGTVEHEHGRVAEGARPLLPDLLAEVPAQARHIAKAVARRRHWVGPPVAQQRFLRPAVLP